MNAAGRAVFFAGCTVILALLGLVAFGIGSLQGLAMSVALTVLVTMLAALTLLPALLGIFGRPLGRCCCGGRRGGRRLGGDLPRRPPRQRAAAARVRACRAAR
jgi:RND superfamily putative drug exporter